MKSIRTILSLLLAATLLVACDQIAEDRRFLTMDPRPLPSNQRTHLLVDFSAFRCLNCPLAAEEAHSLQQIYDSSLIVVTMHPPLHPLTQGTVDYTCPAADVYFEDLGGDVSTPLPTGSVDIVPNEDGEYLIPMELWSTALATRQTDTALIVPSLNVDYEPNSRIFTVRAQTQHLNSQLSTLDYQLILWLVEDSVEGLQLMPDNTVNGHYYHRHLLRESLTEPWGEALSWPQKTSFERTYTLPEDYNDHQAYIVAVVVEPQTHQVMNIVQSHKLNTAADVPEAMLIVDVDYQGEIEEESLSFTVTEADLDPLSGKTLMTVTGYLYSANGQVTVTLTRSTTGLEDEFCCGQQCTVGNKELTETKTFRLSDNGDANWYMHYYPQPDSEVHYQVSFSNGTQTKTMNINFRFFDL